MRIVGAGGGGGQPVGTAAWSRREAQPLGILTSTAVVRGEQVLMDLTRVVSHVEVEELTWDDAMQRGYEALSRGEALYDEIDAEQGRSNIDIEKHLRRAELKVAQANAWLAMARSWPGNGTTTAVGRLAEHHSRGPRRRQSCPTPSTSSRRPRPSSTPRPPARCRHRHVATVPSTWADKGSGERSPRYAAGEMVKLRCARVLSTGAYGRSPPAARG